MLHTLMNSRLQIGDYSEDAYKVDSDFLVERRDIIDYYTELNLRKMNKTEN